MIQCVSGHMRCELSDSPPVFFTKSAKKAFAKTIQLRRQGRVKRLERRTELWFHHFSKVIVMLHKIAGPIQQTSKE